MATKLYQDKYKTPTIVDTPNPGATLDLALRRLAFSVDQSDAWLDLGRSLQAAGRQIDALTAFGEALRLAADPFAVASDFAEATIASGQAATEICKRRVSNGPDVHPADMLITARLHRHLGELKQAATLLEVARIRAPASKEIATELAMVRCDSAMDGEAEAALRGALALDPGADEVRHRLAKVLMRLERPHAARHELASCLSTNDQRCVDMALLDLQLGFQDEARSRIERRLESGEDDPEMRRLLAIILAYADGVSGQELSEAMCRAGDARRVVGNPPAPTSRGHAGKLRLGILGGGLWRHPSSWLTIRGVEALDPSDFEIHCFSSQHKSDEFAARWRALSAGWHSTRDKTDEQVAHMVRKCAVDILIDLGGYLNCGRMSVMAHRPACLQIKWVGAQFHTSGFPEIDGFVTDIYETPSDLAHLYRESLIRLPGSYVCYDPPGSMPDISPLPADENGFITFGSFNNLMKITPCALDAWAEIMSRVEGSHLRMRTPQFDEDETRSAALDAFVTRGLAPDRLHLSGSADHATILSDQNAVDIALQPFPYCGGVTLLEALAMGVPSVAWVGETFASRHGLSHLSNVGLSDYVADSTEAYVATAVSKAADRPGLRRLRTQLRSRLLDSPICDANQFGREFTRQIQSMWREKA